MASLWNTDLEYIYSRVAEDGIVAPIHRLVFHGYRWLGCQVLLPSLLVSVFIMVISHWFMRSSSQSGIEVMLLIASYAVGIMGLALYLWCRFFGDENIAFVDHCYTRATHLFGTLLLYTLLPYLMLRFLPVVGYFLMLYFMMATLFAFFIVSQRDIACHKAVVESLIISSGRWTLSFTLLGLPCFLFFVISEGLLYRFPILLANAAFQWTLDVLVLSFLLPWVCLLIVFLYQFLLIDHKTKLAKSNKSPATESPQQSSRG